MQNSKNLKAPDTSEIGANNNSRPVEIVPLSTESRVDAMISFCIGGLRMRFEQLEVEGRR